MAREALALLESLYGALHAGDEQALFAVLHPRFHARYADGLPVGGGTAEGPAAAREHWWAIGAEFEIRAEVEEVLVCPGERLLALGTYRGTRRRDGRAVDARFMHLWTTCEGRLSRLEQVTDTARW